MVLIVFIVGVVFIVDQWILNKQIEKPGKTRAFLFSDIFFIPSMTASHTMNKNLQFTNPDVPETHRIAMILQTNNARTMFFYSVFRYPYVFGWATHLYVVLHQNSVV